MKIAILGMGHMGSWLAEALADEHDQMMAYSLTIPFVSSMIFAGCVDATTAPGTTFKRHMTIARHLLAEDDHLLAEILFNPHSVAQLGRVTSQLEFLKHIIKGKDYEVAKEFFAKLRQNIVEPTGVRPKAEGQVAHTGEQGPGALV